MWAFFVFSTEATMELQTRLTLDPSSDLEPMVAAEQT